MTDLKNIHIHTEDADSKYDLESLKETFENESFTDGQTALANSQKKLAHVLTLLKSKGIEKISVLTRRIEKTHMNANKGITKKLYNIELSFHILGTIDDLLMYDASLVNYNLGSESVNFSETVFTTLSCEEGVALGKLSTEEIEELVQLAKGKGDEELAKKIYYTWLTFHKYNDKEEQIYD